MKKPKIPTAKQNTAPKGALPAKQRRSRELRDRIIECGRVLIEQGGFAGTSMAEIAQAAECSVGALYFRFPGKEALFDCVLEQATSSAVDQIRARAADGRYRFPTVDEVIYAVVDDFSEFIHDNQGLIRAIYQRALEDPQYWTMIRNTGFAMVAVWTSEIMESAGRPGDMHLRRQIRIACAQVTSVLTYSALVPDHAGSRLSREEQTHWLTVTAAQIIKAPGFTGEEISVI